jgi:hypothetical protein
MKFFTYISSIFEQPKQEPSTKKRSNKRMRNGQEVSRRIQLWVTESEARFIKRQASSVGKTINEFTRMMVMDGANMQEIINRIQSRPARSKKKMSRDAPDELKLKIHLPVALSEDMTHQIDAMAERHAINRPEFIRRAVQVYLEILQDQKEVTS